MLPLPRFQVLREPAGWLMVGVGCLACQRTDRPSPSPATRPADRPSPSLATRPADRSSPSPATRAEATARSEIADAAVQRRLITEAHLARRLARAIYSDLALYNEKAIADREAQQVAAALGSELAEARTLFRSRVSPALHGIFEEEFGFLLGAVRLRLDSPESARFFARKLLEAARRAMPAATPAAAEAAINEARQLYRSRVPRSLHTIFESTASELGLLRKPSR